MSVSANSGKGTVNLAARSFVTACLIVVINLEGNSCADTMLVNYTDLGFFEATTCEGGKSLIECPKGSRIQLISANYGWEDEGYCPSKARYPTKCTSNKTMGIIEERCAIGKEEEQPPRSCAIDATNEVFGETCPGLAKYLQIYFKCISACA